MRDGPGVFGWFETWCGWVLEFFGLGRVFCWGSGVMVVLTRVLGVFAGDRKVLWVIQVPQHVLFLVGVIPIGSTHRSDAPLEDDALAFIEGGVVGVFKPPRSGS